MIRDNMWSSSRGAGAAADTPSMETLLIRQHRRLLCQSPPAPLLAPFRPPLSSSIRTPPLPLSPFVVRAAKGKRRYGPGIPQPQQRVPSFPKIEDDGNPKFVVFVRDKRVPLWLPLNIITGGNLAKIVVTAMGNEWGKKMAQSTLTRDLGNALYKDEKTIRMTAIKAHPMLKTATELEYGYKIVNMEDQRSAFMPSNVTKIPPKEELKSAVDKVKDFFGESVNGMKDAFNFGDQDSSEATNDK